MEVRDVNKLRANPLNPRGEVGHDPSLRELAASIKSQGVLQPILITPDGTIVAGHRRVAAARLVDVSSVPVIVRELTETQQLEVMLVENLQRADLTLLQTAKAYKALTERGLTVELISKTIGVLKRNVKEHLAILTLPEVLWKHFDGGALSIRCVPYLLELEPDDQARIGEEAASKRWGSIKVSIAVHRIKNPKPQVEVRRSVLDRIWERVEDGCYTFDSITKCGECNADIFGLSPEQLEVYLQKFVDDGKAEWRREGRRTQGQPGETNKMCVPVGVPSGDVLGRERERTAWSAEAWS